jgi:PKD repeat protein
VLGNQLIVTDSFPNATNYTWRLWDGTTYESPNPRHTFEDPGIYSVCLEARNECTQNSKCKNVNVSLTASKTELSAKGIAIYTNPVSSVLNVQLPASQHQGLYQILTARGKVLNSGAISTGSGDKTINIGRIAPEPGLYLLKLERGGETFTKRFVVQ